MAHRLRRPGGWLRRLRPGHGSGGGRALALLVAIGLGGALYLGITSLQDRWERRSVSRELISYNVTFNVGQARAEVQRLSLALLRHGLDLAPREAVGLAFDIVANRSDLLAKGGVFRTLHEDPAAMRVIAALAAFVARHGDAFDRWPQDPGAVRALAVAADLAPLEPALSELAALTNLLISRRITEGEAELDDAFVTLVQSLAGLTLCGLVMLVLLARLRGRNRLLKDSEAMVRLQKLRSETALDNMSLPLCMVDPAGRPIVCNRAFADMFGLSPQQVLAAASADAVFERPAGMTAEADGPRERISAAIWDRQLPLHRGRGRSGQFLVEAEGLSVAVMHHPTPEGGWVATYADVTAVRQAEARMLHMAKHDALTGLANRVLFTQRMDRSLGEQQRRGDGFALLCLDLDQFKEVNDTLGHPAGDALLVEVAARLLGCVRGMDMVARLGGDEFAILQSGADARSDAARLSARIVAALGEPFLLQGRRIELGCSIGIAVAPTDGADADLLMRNADMALYQAKADGRGVWRFFSTALRETLEAQRDLEAELRGALARGELSLRYQPQLNLRSGLICGCESLLRWHHPRLGHVSPGLFVPVAEKIGMIAAFGTWVLNQACRDALSWPEDICVAVNVSAVQFKTSDVVREVAEALAASGLPPHRLELEITETVLLLDSEQVTAALMGLRALGVRMALDDFGTGHSSPSYLLKFPFDKVKIDQSFVSGSEKPARSLAIVRAISNLADELGMETTAEGVETEAQLGQMRQVGCTEVQGYLVSRPVPLAEMQALIGRNHARRAAPRLAAATLPGQSEAATT